MSHSDILHSQKKDVYRKMMYNFVAYFNNVSMSKITQLIKRKSRHLGGGNHMINCRFFGCC